ncbi:glycosyltransferase [Candidatus Uhrbacteria bacterium]|nr:glycosyltransferase [Candidatus Uhrbacteria bacterium]
MRILIAVPAHNEELCLEKSLRHLLAVLPSLLTPHAWEVVVAENGSHDGTTRIVERLQTEEPLLRLLQRTEPGKGGAIKAAWTDRQADVYGFIDADLSPNPSDIPKLLTALEDYDVAIASRRIAGAEVEQSTLRRAVSGAYNAAASTCLRIPVRDLQCGLKLVRREAVEHLLPLVEDTGYFFDTEFLALAHTHGFRIAEVPIRWQETPDPRRKSSLGLFRTGSRMARDVWRLRRRMKTDGKTRPPS